MGPQLACVPHLTPTAAYCARESALFALFCACLEKLPHYGAAGLDSVSSRKQCRPACVTWWSVANPACCACSCPTCQSPHDTGADVDKACAARYAAGVNEYLPAPKVVEGVNLLSGKNDEGQETTQACAQLVHAAHACGVMTLRILSRRASHEYGRAIMPHVHAAGTAACGCSGAPRSHILHQAQPHHFPC